MSMCAGKNSIFVDHRIRANGVKIYINHITRNGRETEGSYLISREEIERGFRKADKEMGTEKLIRDAQIRESHRCAMVNIIGDSSEQECPSIAPKESEELTAEEVFGVPETK